MHVGDAPAAVHANRATVAGLVGLEAGAIAVLDAEHGDRVHVVTHPGVLPPGDAAVTTSAGIGLVALAADCVPIALASTGGVPAIGVVHCGWKGLAAGVVEATVAAMTALGGTHLRAVVAPSICARCYPCASDRIDALRSSVGTHVADAATWLPGSIDVAAGVRAQLRSCDVVAQTCDGCTAESSDLYSFRRDGRTGRQGVIICL